MTAVILVIVAAPISGVLLAAAVQSASSRERTASDQLLASQVESIRTLPYTQVGIVGGNPDGVLQSTSTSKLPNGEAVTITTKVSYVDDPIPTAYVTNADYKKVVVTVTRNSDSRQLSSITSYIASASAPPLAGTDWVQIKRTVVDAVTAAPLPGTSVHLTGGPAADDRADLTDGAGAVLFPALNDSTSGSPVYTLGASLNGYSVYPDDLGSQPPSQVSSAPGINSVQTLRMYKGGATLTVNLQNASGTAYTGGATLSLQSSRCGAGSINVPSGQSSVTVTSCQWATNKTVDLVPNVLGQSPSFDQYSATAYNLSTQLWGSTTPFLVPAAYPNTMTQAVTIRFSSTTYPSTRTLNVTVTRSGSADSNARVLVTGGPAGIYLFGTTDSNGKATFTIPVTPTSTAFTVAANDQGAAQREHQRQRVEQPHDRDLPDGCGQLKRMTQHDGFTLVELLVAMPMLLIVLAGLTTTLIQLTRTSDKTQQETTLQTEARAAMATLESDLRQAFTGDGSNPIMTATATSVTLATPDRYPTTVSGTTESSFHLRKITYSVTSQTLQKQSMTSTNTYPTAPTWTWPGSMGAWTPMVGSITNTDIFTYYTAQGLQDTPATPLSFPLTDTTGIAAVGIKLTLKTTGPNSTTFTDQETVALRSTE